ncbi:MAG TPA: hypothetical protein VMT22_16760 [Terriglobales bacterium]|nr:hypothetical protein [Terriglobales bacterium]
MLKAKALELGSRVKVVNQHWLRGGQVGRVIRFEPRGRNSWLVQFETGYPGGGIDGDKLWLGQDEFAELGEQNNTEGEACEDDYESGQERCTISSPREPDTLRRFPAVSFQT